MINLHFSLKICILLILSIILRVEGTTQELTEKEHKKLLNKELIIKTKTIKGAPWPKLTLFALINATPSECAAIFSYYPDQVKFSPGLKEAKPVKYITPTNVHVLFKMNMPWPLRDSVFITGNRLSRLQKGGYKVEWYFVKSDNFKKNSGSAQFIPYKNNTIYRYQNFVYPTSTFAKMFKGKMLKNTKKSVLALVSYIKKVKKERPDLMKKYIDTLNRALQGEYVYNPLFKE